MIGPFGWLVIWLVVFVLAFARGAGEPRSMAEGCLVNVVKATIVVVLYYAWNTFFQ